MTVRLTNRAIMKRSPLVTPTDLRKAESREAATRMASAILAADSRRAREVELNRGRPNSTKRQAPLPETAPKQLRLADLWLHPLAPRGSRGRR
jgi:hypothetical protein